MRSQLKNQSPPSPQLRVCSDCPQKNKTIEENSMEIYLGALLAECFDVHEVGFIIRKGLG